MKGKVSRGKWGEEGRRELESESPESSGFVPNVNQSENLLPLLLELKNGPRMCGLESDKMQSVLGEDGCTNLHVTETTGLVAMFFCVSSWRRTNKT